MKRIVGPHILDGITLAFVGGLLIVLILSMQHITWWRLALWTVPAILFVSYGLFIVWQYWKDYKLKQTNSSKIHFFAADSYSLGLWKQYRAVSSDSGDINLPIDVFDRMERGKHYCAQYLTRTKIVVKVENLPE